MDLPIHRHRPKRPQQLESSSKTTLPYPSSPVAIALLWELSNGWIGLLLGFHCLGDLGGKCLRVCLWWRLTSGMRSGASLRPSNLLSVSGSPCGAVHIMLYASMVEASERTQSTNECVPKGEAGRAPLTKAVYLKKILFWSKGRDSLSAGLRVKDQSQFLGRGAASAHFPDVD